MNIKTVARGLGRGVLQPLRWARVPVPRAVYQHLYFNGVFTIKVSSTRRFRMQASGFTVENQLYWRGIFGHEPDSMRIWLQLARQARCVFDIGANTGEYALAAKCLAPAAHVVAFEPVAQISSLLRANIALNHFDVRVESVAVSRIPGKLPLFDPNLGGMSYSASLERDFLSGRGKAEVVVDVVSVDSYSGANGLQPDLIKIDVEGHEADVILGAGGTLQSARPVCIVEWLGKTEAHSAAVAMLDRVDYLMLDTLGKLVEHRTEKATYEERNLLLVPREKLGLVRRAATRR